jgi:hypothetical protein
MLVTIHSLIWLLYSTRKQNRQNYGPFRTGAIPRGIGAPPRLLQRQIEPLIQNQRTRERGIVVVGLRHAVSSVAGF